MVITVLSKSVLDGKIQRMIFVDTFEQTTIISFKNIKINSNIDDDLFDFKPPAGADVVGDF